MLARTPLQLHAYIVAKGVCAQRKPQQRLWMSSKTVPRGNEFVTIKIARVPVTTHWSLERLIARVQSSVGAPAQFRIYLVT